jgi:alkanesulfonate monooxygenase SsuD/methylene tetrahydromethanopterin reductase-like flavin-dependent oxidoreductase (luciferase family)
MKFAVTGVGSGSTARPELLVQVAQKAEALGYESVWIPEHLAVPVQITSRYPYSADGKFPGGPGRNPLAVAKAAASVDVLSQGRLLFGVGIGWLEDEFNAVGMPFKDRAARTREWIAMMKALWAEETPQFSGRLHIFRLWDSTLNQCRNRIHLLSLVATAAQP